VAGARARREEPAGLLYAVNREYADPERELHDGDEVALIPPVSGGAFRVTEEPLSLEAVAAEVADERAGGLATFTGTVRRQSRGREVTRLEYEAYAEMAEDVMAQLARELEERYDLCAVAIHHRVGTLAIGEASVVIAVSAPHRQDALAACKDAIDRLKETVPALEEGGLRGRRGVDRPRVVATGLRPCPQTGDGTAEREEPPGGGSSTLPDACSLRRARADGLLCRTRDRPGRRRADPDHREIRIVGAVLDEVESPAACLEHLQVHLPTGGQGERGGDRLVGLEAAAWHLPTRSLSARRRSR
jgi:molybdopterin synthase catalytic subunit